MDLLDTVTHHLPQTVDFLSPYYILYLWERPFQHDGKRLLSSVSVSATTIWSLLLYCDCMLTPQRAKKKSVKQLVFSLINVSKSALMIPVVCLLEDPVTKEIDLNQWFTICQDNDMC